MSAGDERPEVDNGADSAADSVGLDQLEERIHAAADRLRELSADNVRLAARVTELEAAAAEAGEGDSGSKPAASGPADAAAADWRREREEVRRRVEKLARRLADLLGDDAEPPSKNA